MEVEEFFKEDGTLDEKYFDDVIASMMWEGYKAGKISKEEMEECLEDYKKRYGKKTKRRGRGRGK